MIILKIEKRLDISFPLDILKFKKEVGNFQIGTQEEDEYGNDNYPVLSFEALLKWWEKHTDLEEEFNEIEEENEILRERLNQYIIFFSQIQSIDAEHYCLDRASQNLENSNMNILEFHQDSWYNLAINKAEISKEVNIFDKFISKFIDDKINIITDEF